MFATVRSARHAQGGGEEHGTPDQSGPTAPLPCPAAHWGAGTGALVASSRRSRLSFRFVGSKAEELNVGTCSDGRTAGRAQVGAMLRVGMRLLARERGSLHASSIATALTLLAFSWPALEAGGDVLTGFIHAVGVSPSFAFHDVYGLG